MKTFMQRLVESLTSEELTELRDACETQLRNINNPKPNERELALWHSGTTGSRIDAIKALRRRANLSLKDAKDAFDCLGLGLWAQDGATGSLTTKK